jgi:cytochrome P450
MTSREQLSASPPAEAAALSSSYSLTDPLFAENPHGVWAQLREAGVVGCEGEGGFWALSRYADVDYVSKHVDEFCSRFGSVDVRRDDSDGPVPVHHPG